jgi:hypothetical protein
MHREAVARDVADDLSATDTAVEEALFRAVRLMRRLIDARRELGLPVAPGEPVMGRAAAVVAAAGEAQRELGKMRLELAQVRIDLGLAELAHGATSPPAELRRVD